MLKKLRRMAIRSRLSGKRQNKFAALPLCRGKGVVGTTLYDRFLKIGATNMIVSYKANGYTAIVAYEIWYDFLGGRIIQPKSHPQSEEYIS